MPSAMVEPEVIEGAVQTACRAPSLHNIQPWRWVLHAEELGLFLDRRRVLPSDRDARESIIGCGAALDHLRTATAAVGLRADVHRWPDPNDVDHLAAIRFTTAERGTDADYLRAKAIWIRRSDRSPFSSPPHWESFDTILRQRLADVDIHLTVLPEHARSRVIQASQLADSLRVYDSEYNKELFRWTAEYEASSGIPYSALPSAGDNDRVGVNRTFPTPNHGDSHAASGDDQSRIVVLSTATTTPADALTVGEALSEILIDATMAGLATCPVSHLTEVDSARDLIENLLADNTIPQIMIRIGYTPPDGDLPPLTPRRPLDQVLVVNDGG